MGALDDQDADHDGSMWKTVIRFEQIAGPQEVWVSMVAWDKLPVTLSLMKTANDLIRKGDLMRGAEHYTRIYAGTLLHGILCDLPARVQMSDAAPPIIYALRALVDAADAAGLLHLRNLNIKSAQEASDYAHDCHHTLAAMIAVKPCWTFRGAQCGSSSLHPSISACSYS